MSTKTLTGNVETKPTVKHTVIVHLESMIEHKKQRLEITSVPEKRRELLNEIVSLIDMRETYSDYPFPVSSIKRTYQEYRDEQYRLNKAFYTRRIAEMRASGQHEEADSFQCLSDSFDRHYHAEKKNAASNTETKTVTAKKTFWTKLFG